MAIRPHFSLGFDYLYRLDSKWELGFQLDLNFNRSFEHRESDAIVPIVSYSVTDRLPLFFGVGLERERSTGETKWLEQAHTAFRQKDWVNARALATKVLAKSSDNQEALKIKAQAESELLNQKIYDGFVIAAKPRRVST